MRLLERTACGALAALLMASGCAGRVPLPEGLRVGSAAELVGRMAAARSTLRGYSAELRFTYFGEQGRVRGTAVVVVARPDRLRYDVLGPHGGVLQAFATNGKELALLDLDAGRFLHGPASISNMDALLPAVPLGLPPAGWVQLLFGEVEVPGDAALTYDDTRGCYVLRWHGGHAESDIERRLEVDPYTSRLQRAELYRSGEVLTRVEVGGRDAAGVPTEIVLGVPANRLSLEVSVRDIEHDPEVDAGAFVLDPPAGMTPEYLAPQ